MSERDESQTPASGDELRQVMRYWASGVTVVAAVYKNQRHGMTVSSFTSHALEPPLVSVSLRKTTRTHRLVLDSGAFGVTLLAQSQEEVSNRFSGGEEGDRFQGLDSFTLVTGSPFIRGGLAFFDCRVFDTRDAGGQTIFFGEVVASKVGDEAERAEPLVYYNRGYWRLGR